MKVLLIENDLELGNGVRIALSNRDMEVVWVRQVETALSALQSDPYDLMLLDLGLPDGDGLALLSEVRRLGRSLPTIILSARDSLQDRVLGLDSGADDYLVKPFSLIELISRVHALARRCYNIDGEVIALRGLSLHSTNRRVSLHGNPVHLSRCEFDLLALLLKRTDRVLTRRILEEQVLPGGSANASNPLDTHIANLRRKIGDGYIRTVRGIGYVIDRMADPMHKCP